jgi:hypothetical protein
MKGATTDPDVSRMRPLKATNITMIGSNQNFFRALKKCQSSKINSPIEVPFLADVSSRRGVSAAGRSLEGIH